MLLHVVTQVEPPPGVCPETPVAVVCPVWMRRRCLLASAAWSYYISSPFTDVLSVSYKLPEVQVCTDSRC